MNFLQDIKKRILIFDGGTGSVLQQRGLAPGEKPEMWNITHPEEIIRLHKEYLDAGCDIIKTNTFGINSLRFPGNVESLVSAATENAKKATENTKGKYIALDIGPCGKLLKPLGDLEFEDAVALFAQVVKAGEKSADLILIETMNDSLETKAAVLAAKENSSLPVFVTNVYDKTSKLMTGASPEAMVAMLEGLRVDGVGANCSLGPDLLMPTVKRLLNCASVPVIVNPNAGLPKLENGNTFYDISPEEFADYAVKMIKMGASIIGGCCGTTPEHIRLLKKKRKALKKQEIKNKNITCVSSYTTCVAFDKYPVVIGERINPTGKKAFKEALLNNNISYILNEGITQQECGAHILDVNVGLPEIDEPAVIKNVVTKLQEVCDLPLQIDTTNPSALENALRIYNGKPLINSVNGKQESMDLIFPLQAKYGGVIIALTLDENGIPDSGEKRYEIAEKIRKEAAKYGISKKDLIVDPLALTISSDGDAANVTLDALKLLNKNGYKTSLGVSNISFGLPCRENINSAFFLMALSGGLSAAIINPKSTTMMNAYRSFMALSGRDISCEKYIASFSEKISIPSEKSGEITLKEAIVKGLKESASLIAKEEKGIPLDIINLQIIPALDEVGKAFEQGKAYLPQLLMSAEAAKTAFDEIKLRMDKTDGTKYSVVLATVKGDIHDIGKNIVKVLLENYGFNIIDLGKDVPPETIVDTVVKTEAPLVALSALMTTTVPAMEETIKLLKKKCPSTRVIVGGAVLNQEYSDMIKADFYGKDAMEAVRYAEKLYEELNNEKKTL